MTLISLAVVFAYFTHPRGDEQASASGFVRVLNTLKTYRFWRTSIIVSSAIPIAILTNAFRVSGTGILAHQYGNRVADGFFHSFSGWVMYIVAFLLLFAIGWVLDRGRGIVRIGSSRNRKALAGKTEPPGPRTTIKMASVKGAE
jgi:exosortase/archaeosortase family protein